MLRNWEASTTNAYLSDYMKNFQDNPEDSEEVRYKELYPTIVAGATLTGPLLSNFTTLMLIKMIGSDNPMAIPYVCILRMVIAIPSVYCIFILNKGFWFSIGGLYVR